MRQGYDLIQVVTDAPKLCGKFMEIYCWTGMYNSVVDEIADQLTNGHTIFISLFLQLCSLGLGQPYFYSGIFIQAVLSFLNGVLGV